MSTLEDTLQIPVQQNRWGGGMAQLSNDRLRRPFTASVVA
jgi:hypothetical protein